MLLLQSLILFFNGNPLLYFLTSIPYYQLFYKFFLHKNLFIILYFIFNAFLLVYSMDRIYEIDIFRGFAVIAMVIFHYFYIFYLMGKSDTAVTNNFVICLAKFAHITFIVLFGVNLALS